MRFPGALFAVVETVEDDGLRKALGCLAVDEEVLPVLMELIRSLTLERLKSAATDGRLCDASSPACVASSFVLCHEDPLIVSFGGGIGGDVVIIR
jgi:hypothetical protein